MYDNKKVLVDSKLTNHDCGQIKSCKKKIQKKVEGYKLTNLVDLEACMHHDHSEEGNNKITNDFFKSARKY